MTDNIESEKKPEKVTETRNKKNSGLYKNPNNKAAAKYIKNRYYTDEEFRTRLLERRKEAYHKKRLEKMKEKGIEPPKDEYITIKKVSAYDRLKQKEEECKQKEEEMLIKERAFTKQLEKKLNKSLDDTLNNLIDKIVNMIKDDIEETPERKKLIKKCRRLKKSDSSDDE